MSRLISSVVLWGNADGTPVQKALLRMDNGYSQEIGPLPERGLPMVVDIPGGKQKGIREMSISILDAGGAEGGLAEAEAFSELKECGCVQPYVQITCDDNFVYEYNRKSGEEAMNIGCYCWKVSEPVKYKIFGNALLGEGILIFCENSGVVSAACAGNVYCISTF